jgi:hypothetical protein
MHRHRSTDESQQWTTVLGNPGKLHLTAVETSKGREHRDR